MVNLLRWITEVSFLLSFLKIGISMLNLEETVKGFKRTYNEFYIQFPMVPVSLTKDVAVSFIIVSQKFLPEFLISQNFLWNAVNNVHKIFEYRSVILSSSPFHKIGLYRKTYRNTKMRKNTRATKTFGPSAFACFMLNYDDKRLLKRSNSP